MPVEQIPLSMLTDRVAMFMRDDSLRLLHVMAPGSSRASVVDLVAAQEYRPENRAPFVFSERSFRADDEGWEGRIKEARTQHDLRRERMASAGESLDPLPDLPPSVGLRGFVEQLGQLLQTRPEGTEGLMVLLAPALVEAQPRWQAALEQLLGLNGLSAVRWMVVDGGPSSIGALATRDDVSSLECVEAGPSPKALLAGVLDEELPQWRGPLGARPKGVVPPPRIDGPPPAEVTPEHLARVHMAKYVLEASAAHERGALPEAVAAQRKARDVCREAGWVDQEVQMELMLGGYLLAGGSRRLAEASCEQAAKVAEDAGKMDQVAMARLAKGSCEMAELDRSAALVTYAQAATAAEEGGDRSLTVEACRLAGDTAASLSMEAQAITFWSKAVKTAQTGQSVGPQVGAGQSALNLAVLCQHRGLKSKADEFLDTALVLLEPPKPPELDVEVGLEEPNLFKEDQRPPVPTEQTPVQTPPMADEISPPSPADVPVQEGPSNWEPTPPFLIDDPVPPSPVVFTPSPLPPEEIPSHSTPAPDAAVDGTIMLSSEDMLDVDEITSPTEALTLDDLVRFHWEEEEEPSASEGSERSINSEPWSPRDEDTLRQATRKLLDEDTGELLLPKELASLRGEGRLPPARHHPRIERTVRLLPEGAPAPAVGAADQTQWISSEQLAAMRRPSSKGAVHKTRVDSSLRQSDDEVKILTLDDIAAIVGDRKRKDKPKASKGRRRSRRRKD